MLSIEQLTEDSFPVAIIRDREGNKKVRETVYYTEPTRAYKKQPSTFESQVEEYLADGDPPLDGAFRLQEKYSFEMVPTIGNEKNPRFINYYLSGSNSGKSYQIASLCKRYLQQFPENMIAYASANPIENDKNYDKIRDKINVIDVLNLDSIIDFSNPDFHNSLFIFDDCDSGFSVSYGDLDKRLTQDEVDSLTVTEKQKATRMLKHKCEMASTWINKSVQSFMMNGRKFKESVCIVAHKPNSGESENKVIGESNGVILFPASVKKNTLETFIVNKLSFEKADAKALMSDIEWYQYDFLYISHRTSKQFIITDELIKVYY